MTLPSKYIDIYYLYTIFWVNKHKLIQNQDIFLYYTQETRQSLEKNIPKLKFLTRLFHSGELSLKKLPKI